MAKRSRLFWPKVTVTFGQKRPSLLAKSSLFHRAFFARSRLLFWPKAGFFFGQKPATLARKKPAFGQGSRLLLAKDGPTGLRYTGIHGNTGNTRNTREYWEHTGIPGIPGIPGTLGIHGNTGNTREYRKAGFWPKSRLLAKEPAFGQKSRSWRPAGRQGSEPGSVG